MRRAISLGELRKLEAGVYCDEVGSVPEISIIQKKYSNAVITLKSAFMYHGLTDTIPDHYNLATGPKSAAIADTRVEQFYMPEGTLDIGKTEIEYEGVSIVVYDLERMLIELMRFRTKLAYDYYKEVLNNYRANIDRVYPAKLDDYLEAFPKRDAISEALDREVF